MLLLSMLFKTMVWDTRRLSLFTFLRPGAAGAAPDAFLLDDTGIPFSAYLFSALLNNILSIKLFDGYEICECDSGLGKGLPAICRESFAQLAGEMPYLRGYHLSI